MRGKAALTKTIDQMRATAAAAAAQDDAGRDDAGRGEAFHRWVNRRWPAEAERPAPIKAAR